MIYQKVKTIAESADSVWAIIRNSQMKKENLMPGMVARAVIKASDPRRVITLPRQCGCDRGDTKHG